MHYLPDTPLRLARRVPDLGAQQRTFRDFDTFSTFKGPQYAPTPSKTALTTAPTQVIVRCILIEAASTCPVAALAALQVLQVGHAAHRSR